MTYAKREAIFSKEYLSIADLQELFDLEYQGAAKMIRDIKRGLEFSGQALRLDMQAKFTSKIISNTSEFQALKDIQKQ